MNPENLTPWSELNGQRVSDDDADVRGWTVIAGDGREIGRVRELLVDASRMKVEYFAVGDGSADDLLVPAGYARVDATNRQVHVGTGAFDADERLTAQRDSAESPADARPTPAQKEFIALSTQLARDLKQWLVAARDELSAEQLITLRAAADVIDRTAIRVAASAAS